MLPGMMIPGMAGLRPGMLPPQMAGMNPALAGHPAFAAAYQQQILQQQLMQQQMAMQVRRDAGVGALGLILCLA